MMLITKYNNFIKSVLENLEISSIFNTIKTDIKKNIPLYTSDNNKLQTGNDNLYYILTKIDNKKYLIIKFYIIDITTELSDRNNPIKKLNIIKVSDSFNGIYKEGKNIKITMDIYQNFIFKDIDKLINKFKDLKSKKGIPYILPDSNGSYDYIKYNLNNKKIHKSTPDVSKNNKELNKNDKSIKVGNIVIYGKDNRKAKIQKIENIEGSDMATLVYIDNNEIIEQPIDINILKKYK